MSRFLPVRRLSTAEQGLIPEAFFVLLWMRIAVSFLPSKSYLPQSRPAAAPAEPAKAEMETAKRMAGVIEGISRRTPWPSTCLVKALALRRMLKRRGIPCTLHLGIHKNKPQDRLGAHAWLSVAGEVLIGGWRLERYAEIARLD